MEDRARAPEHNELARRTHLMHPCSTNPGHTCRQLHGDTLCYEEGPPLRHSFVRAMLRRKAHVFKVRAHHSIGPRATSAEDP